MTKARDPEELRRALAAAGVGLFEPPAAAPDVADPELSALIAELLRSGDARLLAAVPCVIVRHAERARGIVEGAARQLPDAERSRLGYLHRLARALAVSRRPDLLDVLGHEIALEAVPFEPSHLPGPDEDYGERCLSIARELEADDRQGSTAGDVEDLFDTWLRELALTACADA